ncbi:MAG: hypothetical protein LBE56_04180 [Tannerella sp.]|jgi:tetratricopeptide (TPR) repeat protein|nr:hypothetical protein [Tannerella sp.]
MQTNPIMERIVRLNEQFKASMQKHTDARIVCWLGASASEYKMIKGFVMYNMSEESDLDDLFVSCQQPFNSETAEKYGLETCKLMEQYIEAWNEDDRLTSKTGIIAWKPQYDERRSDAANFVHNMNSLAKSFACSREQKLIVAILPQRIDNLYSFKEWITEIIGQPVEKTVCFMLYDNYNERLYDSYDKKFPDFFVYIQPDMDLYGAVNQILENAKQDNKDEQEQDVIAFQQLLVKLSIAVSGQDRKQALDISDQAIRLAKKHEMYHLEALVHYFLYNLFFSLEKDTEAEKEIENTLLFGKKAFDSGIEGSAVTYAQYLIVKGNSFLFKQKYEKAIPYYREALQMSKDSGTESLSINMCQMLGLCHRKTGDSYTAYDYLTEGWKMIESTMSTGEIGEHQVLCYYAIEFEKVLKGDETYRYRSRFEEIWGENWREKIAQQHKENKKVFKALSIN